MKNTIIVSILGILILPSVTFAAWWNPVSWFKKEKVVTPIVATSSPIVATTTPLVATTTPATTTKVVKQEIKPKPVVKKIELTDEQKSVFEVAFNEIDNQINLNSNYENENPANLTKSELAGVNDIIGAYISNLEQYRSKVVELYSFALNNPAQFVQYAEQTTNILFKVRNLKVELNSDLEDEAYSIAANRREKEQSKLERRLQQARDQAYEDAYNAARYKVDTYNSYVGQGRGQTTDFINTQLYNSGIGYPKPINCTATAGYGRGVTNISCY